MTTHTHEEKKNKESAEDCCVEPPDKIHATTALHRETKKEQLMIRIPFSKATMVSTLIGVLFVTSLIQAWQLTTLRTALAESPAPTTTSTSDDSTGGSGLPDMVGGC